jgi:hypothetical protein
MAYLFAIVKFQPIVIYNKSNGLLSNTINDIVFEGDNCCICSDKGVTICTLLMIY